MCQCGGRAVAVCLSVRAYLLIADTFVLDCSGPVCVAVFGSVLQCVAVCCKVVVLCCSA